MIFLLLVKSLFFSIPAPEDYTSLANTHPLRISSKAARPLEFPISTAHFTTVLLGHGQHLRTLKAILRRREAPRLRATVSPKEAHLKNENGPGHG
jgi:hypothetical protein